MNKLSINVLCAIILVIISFGIIESGTIFTQGVSAGMQSAESIDIMEYPVIAYINSTSDDSAKPIETIGTGEHKYKIIRDLTIVMVRQSDVPSYLPIASLIFPVIGCILLIWFIIAFIKFIININRGEIFTLKNVRYLTKLGIIMLLIAVSKICCGLIDNSILNSLNLGDPSLTLSASWSVPWTDILMGLVALLMAKIWDRGIKMKEDQELTI